MTNHNADTSLVNYARIAGFSHIFIVLLAFTFSSFIGSNLILPGVDAGDDWVPNEWLFRVVVASDLVIFITVMTLSWALYVILKTVNKNLALIALIFRLGEGILGCVTVIICLTALQLQSGADYLNGIDAGQRQAFPGFFLSVRGAGYDVLLAIMGIGGTVYSYLFYKSKYVPTVLSAWGLLTYLTILFYGLANVLYPDVPAVFTFVMFNGALFELIFGLWLLVKGVSTEHIDVYVPESPTPH